MGTTGAQAPNAAVPGRPDEPVIISVVTGSYAGLPTQKRFAVARAGNLTVGSLGWHTDPERLGEIFHVEVRADCRRRGVATRLFQVASATEPTLRHSEALSSDAAAWIAGMNRISHP